MFELLALAEEWKDSMNEDFIEIEKKSISA